jgi:tRNA dimethylallyltransferase
LNGQILTIIGPTGVGKTRISVALAKAAGADIISADSRQVYKYLDIGTAKPTRQERSEIRFHLIDFLEPDESYSCGRFARDAHALLSDIRRRGSVPVVCGGTGLYVKAFFEPLHELPPSQKAIKERLTRELAEFGTAGMYERLKNIDPVWAGMIKEADKQRILRGLEVYEITGRPLSSFIGGRKAVAPFSPRYIGLRLPREVLYRKIDQRFNAMIQAGLVDEVRTLQKLGFPMTLSVFKTIGYKEIVDHLEGRQTLEQAVMAAKRRTRNFAKRQMTWFSRVPGVEWFDADNVEINKIVSNM